MVDGRQGNDDVDGGRKEAEFMGLKRGRKQGRGRGGYGGGDRWYGERFN